MKLLFENWRKYVNEVHGLETTWDNVHIDKVFEVIGKSCEEGRKCKTYKASELKSKLPEKWAIPNLDPERVETAQLGYPLIVVVDGDTGEYQYIMDGNHRFANAEQTDAEVQVKELYTDEYEQLFRRGTE